VSACKFACGEGQKDGQTCAYTSGVQAEGLKQSFCDFQQSKLRKLDECAKEAQATQSQIDAQLLQVTEFQTECRELRATVQALESAKESLEHQAGKLTQEMDSVCAVWQGTYLLISMFVLQCFHGCRKYCLCVLKQRKRTLFLRVRR
jgi:uncharacterized protein YhaN